MLELVQFAAAIAIGWSLVAGVVLGVLGGHVSERLRVLCAVAWPVVAIAAAPMFACWTGAQLGEWLVRLFTPRRRKSDAPIPYVPTHAHTSRFYRQATAPTWTRKAA